jgi:prephenate dehydrogenase (NADP+)
MEEERAFRERIYKARDFVFHESRKLIMFNDQVMKEFSLATAPYPPNPIRT